MYISLQALFFTINITGRRCGDERATMIGKEEKQTQI